MKFNIFSKKYNTVLHPFGLESIQQLAIFIKEHNNNNNISFNELKSKTLNVFSFLINNDIIYVLETNWMQNKEYKKTILSNDEIFTMIKKKWENNISDDELYNLAWFKYQNWYVDKLSDIGLTAYSKNWNEFLNQKIGDLEKWIEENKPKE